MSSAMHRMTQRNPTIQPVTEEQIIRLPDVSDVISGPPATGSSDLPPPPPPPFPTLPLPLPPGSNETMSIFVNEDSDGVTEPSNNGLPAALAPLSPSPEQSNSANLDRDVVMRSENASPQQRNEDQSNSENAPAASRGESQMLQETNNSSRQPADLTQAEQINQITRAAATAAAAAAAISADGNDPGAGPSGTSSGPDYSTILGVDVTELPEGVDPSFLAALPEDMRQ